MDSAALFPLLLPFPKTFYPGRLGFTYVFKSVSLPDPTQDIPCSFSRYQKAYSPTQRIHASTISTNSLETIDAVKILDKDIVAYQNFFPLII